MLLYAMTGARLTDTERGSWIVEMTKCRWMAKDSLKLKLSSSPHSRFHWLMLVTFTRKNAWA
eukprot:3776720-Lingulodinium_polyedra.AAC.1